MHYRQRLAKASTYYKYNNLLNSCSVTATRVDLLLWHLILYHDSPLSRYDYYLLCMDKDTKA